MPAESTKKAILDELNALSPPIRISSFRTLATKAATTLVRIRNPEVQRCGRATVNTPFLGGDGIVILSPKLMKSRLTVPFVLAIIAASALAGCSKSESKVAFTDLPPAVQAAIKVQVGDVPVDKIEIEKETEKGQVVYEVETKKDGKKVDFKMDSDGKVITHD